MDVCSNCGMKLDPEAVNRAGFYAGDDACDGILTFNTDPFSEEIRGDFSKSWDCYGNRRISAWEI